MPVIKKETPRRSSRTKAKPSTKSTAIVLPVEPDEPVSSIQELTILLYGEKKIGKTSLLSKFPDAFFFMFEPGGKGLRIIKEQFKDWKKFVQWVDAIVESDHYKTLIIDTVDIAYERCMQYVCHREGWKHPSDAGYGKGWDAVKQEFKEQMMKLIDSGRGVVFTSHCTSKDFLSREGDRYDKLIPTMSNQARDFLAGIVDLILYYGYYGEDRLITISGSDQLEAGHRIEERFLTPKGDRVHSIPAGSSSQEAYNNFLTAWNNEQKTTGKPKVETGLEKVAPLVRGRR